VVPVTDPFAQVFTPARARDIAQRHGHDSEGLAFYVLKAVPNGCLDEIGLAHNKRCR
jgi:hypothetical protein